MDDDAPTPGAPARSVIVAGLGPGDLDRLPGVHRDVLVDVSRSVVVRTLRHPAAAQLAELRPVESCDDLYEQRDTFDDVYAAITDRVVERADAEDVVYAVPGSPWVGEFAVRSILERLPGAEVLDAESFVDAVLHAVGYDPLDRGLRIVDGHHLPRPLVLDCPTIVGHLDAPVVLSDVVATMARVVPEGASVTVCAELGTADERVLSVPIDEVPAELAGLRTSLFVDTEPAGIVGAIRVSRTLRRECPWDRRQTHDSLVTHLKEETAELAEALAQLPDGEVDWVAYDAVEEELGDVLLQVLFHAVIAEERGAFTIDDVGTRLRGKLVRRHPHVFGDVEVDDADEVAANWERIKADEKPGAGDSLMDGVPEGMASLERAAKLQRRAATVGFDWTEPGAVVGALAAEVEELRSAIESGSDAAAELGDVLFTAVNVARHLDVSPEMLVRRATRRFEERFRSMEQSGPLRDLDAHELEGLWQEAKQAVEARARRPDA